MQKRARLKLILHLIVLVVLVFVGFLAVLMLLENSFIYFPTRYPDGVWAPNKAYLQGRQFPKTEDCWMQSSDGVRIHGWYCVPHVAIGADEAEEVPADTVILWFHGNAGNLSYRYDLIVMLMTLPAKVLIIDYRGYGRSGGRPSEEGLYRDARAAWDYLLTERGWRPDQIVIFGKSLGGAPAVDLASQVQAAGLIVQSSFTSIPDMAAATMPFVPRFLVRTKMNSIDKIGAVHYPKLFVHGPKDEVVPYRLGRRLFDAAPEPKRFHDVPNAGHNETYIVGGEDYIEAFRKFLEECRKE